MAGLMASNRRLTSSAIRRARVRASALARLGSVEVTVALSRLRLAAAYSAGALMAPPRGLDF
jgi:hypothetical protein